MRLFLQREQKSGGTTGRSACWKALGGNGGRRTLFWMRLPIVGTNLSIAKFKKITIYYKQLKSLLKLCIPENRTTYLNCCCLS